MYVKAIPRSKAFSDMIPRLYATWKKDLKTPLLITFTFFLVV
jgi:hypothetical protein